MKTTASIIGFVIVGGISLAGCAASTEEEDPETGNAAVNADNVPRASEPVVRYCNSEEHDRWRSDGNSTQSGARELQSISDKANRGSASAAGIVPPGHEAWYKIKAYDSAFMGSLRPAFQFQGSSTSAAADRKPWIPNELEFCVFAKWLNGCEKGMKTDGPNGSKGCCSKGVRQIPKPNGGSSSHPIVEVQLDTDSVGNDTQTLFVRIRNASNTCASYRFSGGNAVD